MADIEQVKATIMKKFEEMLNKGIDSIQNGEKFSSSEIGKEIGKFMNQKLKDLRKPTHCGGKKKSDDEGEKKHKTPRKALTIRTKAVDEEKKKRAPSAWNIYYKLKSAQLKIENEKNGITKTPKEMMAEIALLWKDDKATFKVPSDEEESDE